MIGRDGFCTSLWQGTSTAYTPQSKVDPRKIYDVIIAGGGITGISTALLLQKAGKKCLVLEAATLCFGTTGGTTAHLNTLLDTPYTTIEKNFGKKEAQQVASVTAEAIQLIRDHITQYKINCEFSEADAYLYAQDEKQEKELQAIQEASSAAGLAIQYTSQLPVPIPFTKAIRVNGQAQFHPVKYVQALAKAFEEAGGTIVEYCRLTGADNKETVVVETTLGTFKARDLIFATHIPPGVNLLHLRCSPYRSYAIAVTLEKEIYPKDLAYDMYDPYHYYRTQVINGKKYLIVGGEDHKTGHQENTQYCFTQLEAHTRKYFAVKEVAYRWSSQYFEPADGLPYIGHLPGHPEHMYVATGFSGNGMTYSSVAAIVLKNLLLNQEHSCIALFDPNRIKPVAGFINFITHNADVVKQFVAGKLSSHHALEVMADIANGDAKIVKQDGEKMCIYKSEKGKLHAVRPTCTHMQCDVAWNNAEKSWDCPCHGARYNVDGIVLTGPANLDLAPVKLPVTASKHKA